MRRHFRIRLVYAHGKLIVQGYRVHCAGIVRGAKLTPSLSQLWQVRPPRYAPAGPDVASGDGWAEIGFAVSVPWPMQLIFTDEVIAKYVCCQGKLVSRVRGCIPVAPIWLCGC